MKHFAFAYTLPAFDGCTLKQKFQRHDVHRGMARGENAADVEQQFIARYPGRKILIRYIEEIEKSEEILKFRPAFLDINKHLWWEIGSPLVTSDDNPTDPMTSEEPTPTLAEQARAARAHLGQFDRNYHKQMEYLEAEAEAKRLEGKLSEPISAVTGRPVSESLYCCLCFTVLRPDQCNVREDGVTEDVCVPCAEGEKAVKDAVCPRCGASGAHNCTKMAGQKSSLGPLPMVDHPMGWPYTDPNVPCGC